MSAATGNGRALLLTIMLPPETLYPGVFTQITCLPEHRQISMDSIDAGFTVCVPDLAVYSKALWPD